MKPLLADLPLWSLRSIVASAGGDLILFDLMVVLAAAALAAMAMRRLKLAAIPAYLIVGAAIGEGALGFVRTDESLEAVSHLAIILLLFGVGLQLETSMLRRGVGWLLAVGVGSCLATVAIGWPLAVLFGLSAPAALAVSMALSLSSTAVVLRILHHRRQTKHTTGRLVIAIAIVQDLLVLGMLVVMPLLAAWSDAGSPPALIAAEAGVQSGSWWTALGSAALNIAGVTALIVLGRALLPRLILEAAKGRSEEIMTILSVAVAMAAAVATRALGFSLELGAFLAGFLLSGTTFKHHLAGQIGPARDLFIAVFFTSVGMILHPEVLLKWWWVVALGTGGLVALKTAVISFSAWGLGSTAAVAVVAGLLLAQAGEFSLVLLDKARTLNLLDDTSYSVVIMIVVMSLILTPSLVELGYALGKRVMSFPTAPWLRNSPLRTTNETSDNSRRIGQIIVAGFGLVGRAVAEKLEKGGIPYTVIELNPRTVKTQTELGKSILYGDVGNPEVLQSAGVAEADALIITIPDEEAMLRACHQARRLSPNIFIAARSNFPGKGLKAKSLGADHVTIEEIAAAEAMQRAVVEHLARRAASPDVPSSEFSSNPAP